MKLEIVIQKATYLPVSDFLEPFDLTLIVGLHLEELASIRQLQNKMIQFSVCKKLH
jgi:hypothetical protein